jgi:hypothetical protein
VTSLVPRPKYQFGAVFFFLLIHAGVLAIWWTPPTMSLLAWLAVTYSIRMFGVTAGYHRYFGHRSYKLGRLAQFAMAFLAQSSAQKGSFVVGGASSPASSGVGAGSGCPLTHTSRFLVGERGLGDLQ